MAKTGDVLLAVTRVPDRARTLTNIITLNFQEMVNSVIKSVTVSVRGK